MIAQGCSAADWAKVLVESGFDPTRVRRVHFEGKVRIGSVATDATGYGLCDANICDCMIGRDVRIARVGVRIANYAIGDGAVVEDVGLVETRCGATFGNGVRIPVLNEGGGRQIVIFNELSSQFAHLACLHRYRPALIKKLDVIAEHHAAKVRSNVGSIGPGATVRSVKTLLDVNVEAAAVISGASRLVNGTVLSSNDAPTTVGADVQCEDFIIAQGSSVTGGALLSKTFVGQACRIGKQFSADRSLFFANCDALHGEALCVLAGPFTVTHHKSTLLIGGLFSFFNAGSGTNQSNHHYRLGPVHEGRLERGTKTGSFSHMIWPCRVGPFSTVLGRHTHRFDTSLLPFSVLRATATGRCDLRPGANLGSAGIKRDGAKWPARDGRKGNVGIDRISYDVLSPFTVGRMLEGAALLSELRHAAPRQDGTVDVHGADVNCSLLESGETSYRHGAEMYLLEQLMQRAEQAACGQDDLARAFDIADEAVYSAQWLDIGGMLMPRQRLEELVDAICADSVGDIDAFNAGLDRIESTSAADRWAWVRRMHEQVSGRSLDGIKETDLIAMAETLIEVAEQYAQRVLADARREFADHAKLGFGQDGSAADAEVDFNQVRGTFEEHPLFKTVQEEQAALRARVASFRERLAPSDRGRS